MDMPRVSKSIRSHKYKKQTHHTYLMAVQLEIFDSKEDGFTNDHLHAIILSFQVQTLCDIKDDHGYRFRCGSSMVK
jgi:hypothetical protein